MKIKKGDTVEVLSGNDKGKTGEVLEVIPKLQKVIVKGVNIRKKHVKPRKQGEEGGIIPVECSIHSSKVALVCPIEQTTPLWDNSLINSFAPGLSGAIVIATTASSASPTIAL